MHDSQAPGPPQVTAAEGEALARSGAVLLDVREPDEWGAGHAPGATWIPLGELVQRSTELPEDRQIVAVCRTGGRSERATAWLLSQGRDAINLTGGMQAWAAAGLPVLTDAGAPGTIV